MTPSQAIEDLEAKLAAATKGGWFEDNIRVDGSSGHNDYYTVLFGPSGQILADTLNSDCVRLEGGDEGRFYDVVGQANIRAIAALYNASPALLACARALEKVLIARGAPGREEYLTDADFKAANAAHSEARAALNLLAGVK